MQVVFLRIEIVISLVFRVLPIIYSKENLILPSEKGFPSFIPDELQALKNSGKVMWLQDDEGIIDDYIHYKVTGAHSPLHQVFWIKEENEYYFFWRR